MKNAYLLIILVGFTVLGFQCTTPDSEVVKPEISNVGTTHATISWLSSKSYKGNVFYKPTGTGTAPRSVQDSYESRQHEATVKGLKPSTRYSYWIGKNGKHFQFQTQPEAASPFSFMAVYGDVKEKIQSLMINEVFDFFLTLDPLAKSPASPDPFSEARAYVPVFNSKGIDSRILPGVQPGNKSGSGWTLDWGGLRLIFTGQLENLGKYLETQAPHTFGIVTTPQLVFNNTEVQTEAQTDDETAIGTGKLHRRLLAHNQKNTDSPVSFVWVLGKNDTAREVDGIQYMSIPVERAAGSAQKGAIIRIDVDIENIRAVYMDKQLEIQLRKPPLKGRRTCQECRRLADKGAYEESIKAYKEFIDNNRGHYQIDDAYFAIAEIYDEKLLTFPRALEWYRRLLKEYPSGSVTPLASQRIKYLENYSGHQFKPLKRFERIRKIEFSRQSAQPAQQEKMLQEVTVIIEDYPQCKLAPVMQHWIANRYRQLSLEKAVAAYRKLKTDYPDSPESRDALIEIGETYYYAGQYEEAVEQLLLALNQNPQNEKTITPLIKRAKRNIRRDVLADMSRILLVIFVFLVTVVKPRGLDLKRLKRIIPAVLLLAALYGFGAWLIHEQFKSNLEIILLSVLLALASGLSAFFSTQLANKLGKTPFVRMITGSLTGILFYVLALYLIIYYVNVHYLVLVKL
jgi:tetratricopeptide (TPR) repeat protein